MTGNNDSEGGRLRYYCSADAKTAMLHVLCSSRGGFGLPRLTIDEDGPADEELARQMEEALGE